MSPITDQRAVSNLTAWVYGTLVNFPAIQRVPVTTPQVLSESQPVVVFSQIVLFLGGGGRCSISALEGSGCLLYLLLLYSLEQGFANHFWKGPESKYFRFPRPQGLYYSMQCSEKTATDSKQMNRHG